MVRENIGGYTGESATKSRYALDPGHGDCILCAGPIHVTAPKARCPRSLHQCDAPFVPGCGKWWTWPGSNRRPHRCERCALPAELQAPIHHLPRHARLGNFRADLATSRARTDDLIVANDALSQLSYSPLCGLGLSTAEYFISDLESAPTTAPSCRIPSSNPMAHPLQNPLDEVRPPTSN